MNGLANLDLLNLFPSSPDPRAYYPATSHERVAQNILQDIANGNPFSLVLGDAGSGKTLLVQVLLERLAELPQVVFIQHGHFDSPDAILKAILFDLGIPHQGLTLADLRLLIADSLLNNFAQGGPTLIIQDEAHLLAHSVLEEYRLLGNLEAGRKRAAQIIFLAHPLMEITLTAPELVSLEQRLARNFLKPLEAIEAVDYLLFHGRLAGFLHPLFNQTQLNWILSKGKGVPRLLNHFARVVLQGRQDDQDSLDACRTSPSAHSSETLSWEGITGPEVRLLTKADWNQSAK